MGRAPGYARPLAVALLICGLPLAVAAQEEDGGVTARLSFSERLLWKDDILSARSDLGLTLATTTRTQSLVFSASGSLDKRLDDGVAASWEDPRLSLDYKRESRNTALSFSFGLSERDIDALVFADDTGDGTAPAPLELERGTRQDRSARLRLEFGRQAPFGATLTLGHAQTVYSNTRSTTLLDSDTQSATLAFRFEIDPRITARTTYEFSDLDRDGGTDVRRQTLSAGASLLVNAALTADVDIGVSRVIQSGDVPRRVTEGLFYALALRQEMPNGTLNGSLRSDLDENGRRTTLRVDRNLELRDGSLSFGVGLSRDDDTDSLDPLYSFGYVKDLPRGRFNAAFQQRFASDSAGAETLDSRLQLGLSQELTARDSLSTRLNWRQTTVSGSGGDTSRLGIGIDYTRSLQDDWSLISGYSHSRSTDSGGREETEDTLFIGLRTVRSWRP